MPIETFIFKVFISIISTPYVFVVTVQVAVNLYFIFHLRLVMVSEHVSCILTLEVCEEAVGCLRGCKQETVQTQRTWKQWLILDR